MIVDNIINILHIMFFYGILFSPFIDDIEYKRLILIILFFIAFHFITKYGKCGLVNLEHKIRGGDIHDGYFFRLIKPVICYKRNPFYNYFYLILIYIFILYYQIREAGYDMNFLSDLREVYYSYKNKN